jgi:hypothetical protein
MADGRSQPALALMKPTKALIKECTAPGILDFDPAKYVNHAVHREERNWSESNCYADLWLELLHGMQLDPVAALPFTLALDFEGDQWGFFKYPLEDLQSMYGIDVGELSVWRPLVDQVTEQIAFGRPVLFEVDAFFLPDTAGTTYRHGHEKTTIAAVAIDTETRKLGYFHAASYYVLSGDDYQGAFMLSRGADAPYLPPYTEIAKLDRLERPDDKTLARRAVDLTRTYLKRRPADNPFTRYAARLPADLEWLKGESLGVFHGYAFNTLRQLGANFELAGTFLRWLEKRGHDGLEPAAKELESIATTSKALQFKIARFVNNKKPVDLTPMIATMGTAWDTAMKHLDARFSQ